MNAIETKSNVNGQSQVESTENEDLATGILELSLLEMSYVGGGTGVVAFS